MATSLPCFKLPRGTLQGGRDTPYYLADDVIGCQNLPHLHGRVFWLQVYSCGLPKAPVHFGQPPTATNYSRQPQKPPYPPTTLWAAAFQPQSAPAAATLAFFLRSAPLSLFHCLEGLGEHPATSQPFQNLGRVHQYLSSA